MMIPGPILLVLSVAIACVVYRVMDRAAGRRVQPDRAHRTAYVTAAFDREMPSRRAWAHNGALLAVVAVLVVLANLWGGLDWSTIGLALAAAVVLIMAGCGVMVRSAPARSARERARIAALSSTVATVDPAERAATIDPAAPAAPQRETEKAA